MSYFPFQSQAEHDLFVMVNEQRIKIENAQNEIAKLMDEYIKLKTNEINNTKNN